MGGENSMITDQVKTVLFEAACFNGTNIRLSSKRIGLRTDASGKFEKGLDPNNAEAAINRACQLMEELGAGEVVGGMVDVCSETREPSRVPFEPERINAILGTDLTKEEMLGIPGAGRTGLRREDNEIVAPTFRQDIHCTADVAEEVARFYGYDKIPTTLPNGEATTGKLPFKLRIEQVARDIAEYCGFSEGMTYSFESPKVFEKLRIPADSDLRKVITISNPLGEDYSIMRTTTLNGMLTFSCDQLQQKKQKCPSLRDRQGIPSQVPAAYRTSRRESAFHAGNVWRRRLLRHEGRPARNSSKSRHEEKSLLHTRQRKTLASSWQTGQHYL